MFSVFTAVMLSIIAAGTLFAQNQQQKQQEPEEIAAKEADRLAELLDLEGWQVFYVDSTLQHDFAAMTDEIKSLQKSRVENVSLYQMVQDKWWDKIDEAYRRFFTDEQWEKYLKNGGARNQKARAKRKAKLEKNNRAGK